MVASLGTTSGVSAVFGFGSAVRVAALTNAAFDTGGEGWTVTPTAFGTTAIQDVSGFDVDRSGFSRASQVVWGIREFCCREHFPPLWEAFSMSVSMSVSHPVTRSAHKTSMRGNSRCW